MWSYPRELLDIFPEVWELGLKIGLTFAFGQLLEPVLNRGWADHVFRVAVRVGRIEVLLPLFGANQQIKDVSWSYDAAPVGAAIVEPSKSWTLFGSTKDCWRKKFVEALCAVGSVRLQLIAIYSKVAYQVRVSEEALYDQRKDLISVHRSVSACRTVT
jgi:hypothetical protein